MNKNPMDEHNTPTPDNADLKNTPYILKNHELSPISDDIKQIENTPSLTTPRSSTAPVESTDKEPNHIKTDTAPKEAKPKRHYLAIIFTIIPLAITLFYLLSSSGFDYTPINLFKKETDYSSIKQNIYLDIASKCPVLKDNISKLTTAKSQGYSLIVTKNGDLYFLPLPQSGSSTQRLTNCEKINNVSNIKDIMMQKDESSRIIGFKLLFKDNTTKTYQTPSISLKGELKLYENKNDNSAFPLSDAMYSDGIAKFNIKKYFSFDEDSRIFFVDSNNNIYNDDFEKYIDGSIFDSDIRLLSSDDYSIHGLIIASEKYVYIFKDKMTVKDEFGLSPKALHKANFIEKKTNFYNIEVKDIHKIDFNKDYKIDKEGYYYVTTNKGDIYRFVRQESVSNKIATVHIDNALLIYMIIGIFLIIIISSTILSYRGETKSYLEGLPKMLLLAITLGSVVAISKLILESKGILPHDKDLTFIDGLILLAGALAYFTIYYIVKKITWFIIHKSNIRSKLLYAVIYILVYTILLVTIIKIKSIN